MIESLERTTEKGPIKLTIRITPAAPRLSDLVEMEVIVTAERNIEIVAPTFGQAVGDFLVRDYSETISHDGVSKPTPNTRTFRYQLEPVYAGLHLIRSMAVEFIDHRSNSENKDRSAVIESEPIEVQVASEFGDKIPDLADLEPIVPPKPLTSSYGWLWFGLLPVPLILAAMAWLYRRRKAVGDTVVQPTPAEIARRALAALLEENLPAKGLVQEFYLRLTSIVRHYIEGTTGVRAPEQTTEEFLRDMHRRGLFEPNQSARLQDFLQAADMVKYAGQQPTPEQIETSIARANEFIEMRSTVATPAVPILVEV
jgi:hypothetical protein